MKGNHKGNHQNPRELPPNSKKSTGCPQEKIKIDKAEEGPHRGGQRTKAHTRKRSLTPKTPHGSGREETHRRPERKRKRNVQKRQRTW